MCSCPHCGESYFTAQTLHEIERIKALRKSVAVDRPVPVAVFQESHAQPFGQTDALKVARRACAAFKAPVTFDVRHQS